MPLTALTLRFECNQESREPLLPVDSELDPIIYRGSPTNVKAVLFDGVPATGTFVSDISNITSARLVIRKNHSLGTVLIDQTATLDGTTTYANWVAGTKQHFLFPLTDTQTNQTTPSDGTLDVYGVLTATTASGVLTLGYFNGSIKFNGVTGASVPAPIVPNTALYAEPDGDVMPATVGGNPLNLPIGTTLGGSPVGVPSDVAFAASWNGVTSAAPSKNAVYDIIHAFDTDDDGKVNVLDVGAGVPKTDASGVVSLSTNATAFDGLTGAANKIAYFTSGSAMAVTDFSAFARTYLDDADAASVRSTIGAPKIFNVKDYGAIGDGVTNDTAAIQSAINALAANKGGTVYFPNGVYIVSGALQDTSGANAQLTLPSVSAPDSEQYTVRLLGEIPPSQIPWYLGGGNTPASGVVIKSTLSSGNGALLGGYGPVGSFQNFTNITVVVENIDFRMVANPTNSCLNFFYVNSAVLKNVVVDAGNWVGSTVTQPTTATSYGIKMPQNNNGGNNRVDQVHVIGFYSDYLDCEHSVVGQLELYHAIYAVEFQFTGFPSKFSSLLYHNCTNGLRWTGAHPVKIDLLKVEHTDQTAWYTSSYDIVDASNNASGSIAFTNITSNGGYNTSLVKNGGAKISLTPLRVGTSIFAGNGSAVVGFSILPVSPQVAVIDFTNALDANASTFGSDAAFYSDGSYTVLNSKTGANALYLNFDNSNASATVNLFNGKFIFTQPGNLNLATNGAIGFAGTGAATTRTNLGLGTAAVQNTGTSGNTIPFLDGANTWSGASNLFNLGGGGTFKIKATLGSLSTMIDVAPGAGGAGLIGFFGATPVAQQTGDVGTALTTFGLMSGTPTFNGTVGATTPATGAFTTLSNTGAATNSKAGAASTAALTLSGVPFAGTGTTSFPLLYINDANATASTTLSTAGTYLGVNGDGTQDLMNLLKDGTSQCLVSSGGNLTITGAFVAAGNISAGASSKILWTGRSRMYAGSDGVIDLVKSSDSGFTRLNFGSATASNSGAGIGYDAVNGVTFQSAAGTATWNDSSTANSGTVANRYMVGIAAPTLTATGTSVTDTVASTVYIGGAPTASTNTTITTPYALNVNAGATNLGGSVKIGGGTTILKILSATATLDFGSTAAGAVSDLTITVTGAALGDVVSLGIPHASVPVSGTFSAWVSATDTVTVRYENNDLLTARDPASGTFRAMVTQF